MIVQKPSINIEVSVYVNSGGRRRKLQAHHLNGSPYIGVLAGESFEVEVYNPNPFRVSFKLSLGGIDPTTGNDADLKKGEKYLLNGYGRTSVKSFMQGPKGGSAFVFAAEELSVAAARGKAGLPRNLISIAVWYEPRPQAIEKSPMAYRGEISAHGPMRGAGPLRGASLSVPPLAAAEPASRSMGVGAGAFVQQEWQTVPGLVNPLFGGYFKIWFMAASDLTGRLEAQATQDQEITGYLPEEKETSGFADLGGVMQVGSGGERLEVGATDNEIQARWPRFAD